ncbi:TetR/AcrR family transcriptional regulator [Nocardioides ginsengisoli]|uniref:TetR/AcrR family transcriptional regulator n=3 Tax=Nocardioides TaxID=1839 RepID=A0A5C4W198_9ACTN|nr:TetR/AcrR family transcriptional regulator [Nocardioides albidus]NYD32014.1 AcrR family transcriptional regulator [Nocardioides kongjuensis]TNM41942.1 TetR/AcrR family transcriptional regulator [Nocardioides albidus]
MAYVRAAEREEQIVAATLRVLRATGVAGLTLRAVATEAGVPLGTLHYVFPTKELLLRSVIDTVIRDLAAVLRTDVDLDRGLEHALRQSMMNYWRHLVESDTSGQIVQYELTTYSVRSESALARLQYESYVSVASELFEQAATAAGEVCAIAFDELARLSVAGTDGLILQYLADPAHDRAMIDLERLLKMLHSLAAPQAGG